MKMIVLSSSSSGNCYLLTSSTGETLILECGVSLKEIKKALKFDISGVVGALSSHAHKDHSGYIPELVKAGIPVYSDGLNSNRHIEAGQCISVGKFQIMAFVVYHDALCIGFLINHTEMGTMLFATDTGRLPYKFRNLNHILIECNHEDSIMRENVWNGIVDAYRAERTRNTHLSLQACIEILKRNDLSAVRNIVLIHLSPQNADAELFRSKVIEATGKNVFVASKGLEVDFSKEPY